FSSFATGRPLADKSLFMSLRLWAAEHFDSTQLPRTINIVRSDAVGPSMTDRKSGSARQQPSGTQMPNPREVAVSDNFGPTPPVLIEEVEAIERHLYDLLDHLFETPAPCGASAPHRSSGMRT